MKTKYNPFTGQPDYVQSGDQFVGSQKKQYSEAAGDFEVTGVGGWATTYAIITPYQTVNGEWEADGVIAGDLTVAATSGYTLNISETIFKNVTGFFQPCTCWIKNSSSAWTSDIELCSALPNSGQIYLEAPSIKSIYVEFHASLEEKPTFAEEFPAINLSTNALAVRDQYRNLRVARQTFDKIDIAADELILQNSLGLIYRASSLSLEVDITVSGAGGLDTGTGSSATWYHAWVIYNGTTCAGLLSLSATNPTMPSGYAFKAYVGAAYYNNIGDFDYFYQKGKLVGRIEQLAASSLTNTSYLPIDLYSFIPPNCKTVNGSVYMESTPNGFSTDWVRIAAESLGTFVKRYVVGKIRHSVQTSDVVQMGTFFECLIIEPQTIYTYIQSALYGRKYHIYVSGYELE